MKNKFRIIRDYKRCSNAAFLVRCTNVYNSMNGNGIYPQPPVLLETCKQLVDELGTCMVDAQHHDRLKSAQKNAVIVILTGMLDQLADYVTATAKGDEAKLLSSGFAISGTSTGADFTSLASFTVKIGPESGQVRVQVKRIIGATTYMVYYGIDNGDQTVWLHEFQPRTKFILSDLQPGKTYVFKVQVGGASGKTGSLVITKVVA